MKAKLARWGNSTGLRVPAEILQSLGLGPGAELSVSVSAGVIELRPLRRSSRHLLDELVAEARRLGPEHEPAMLDWGPDRGSEIIDDEYSRGEITREDVERRRDDARRR